MVIAERGAGVQQHLEDAKKGTAGEGGGRDQRDGYRVELMVIAETGTGGQQHLEDAKKGLLEREGAGISVTCRG
jgi:hypothetical protein